MMPGYNRTGPMGYGPMTGRGMGSCSDTVPQYGRRFQGTEGFGQAMGRGRGFRRGFGSDLRRSGGRRFARRQALNMEGSNHADRSDEIEMLKSQAESMKTALDEINARMQQLEKADD
jgi:hypothetical protein